MVLLFTKNREVKAFSIKFFSCPVHVHGTNKNYPLLMKKIKARLEIFRQRATLGLDIFTGEPRPEISPEKEEKRKKY